MEQKSGRSILADRFRIGVDIGGTFTDFTLIDMETGEIRVEKCLTTHGAPEDAVLTGIGLLEREVPGLLPDTARFVHATTLVTNTILERKGARTGLLTTRGFRDILEIQREVRYDLFDMFIRMPEPLVPRHLRLEATERVLADGTVRTELSEEDVLAAARHFRQHQVEAVAIAFLHSYKNPAHEDRAAEILARELPGVVISKSSVVHPEPKEYERSSTTVTDAYVKRVLASYLDRLQAQLEQRGFRRRMFMMLSNGGTTAIEAAKQVPIQLVESGPAAGVEAAAFYGKLLGIRRLLSFDMGGTTAKLCVIEDGRAARTREFEVDRVHRFKKGSGLPVMVPVYDLLEIGSGGGSIARLNDLGLLQVGPDSAGSEPGPVCYGGGGTEPTVTDADLILGHLDADSFLGGSMKLARQAAYDAIRSKLAEPGGISVERAASGICELVNETMASAARMYVAEKGSSPSELTMLAFGGAGPVHAVGLARKLGCPRVVIPPLPGVMSSFGLLVAPIAFERGRPVKELLDRTDLARLAALFDEAEADARANMPGESKPVRQRFVDLRYHGQDHTLEIDVAEGAIDEAMRDQWKAAFVAQYQSLYGKIDSDNAIEIAGVRVILSEMTARPELPRLQTAGTPVPAATRKLWSQPDMAYVDAPVYRRAELPVGAELAGPAIVEERESTTVIGVGDTLSVNEVGCLVITLASERQRDGRPSEGALEVNDAA